MKKNMLPIVIPTVVEVSCMNAQVGIHTAGSASALDVAATQTAVR